MLVRITAINTNLHVYWFKKKNLTYLPEANKPRGK